jgi:hypothetical protein
MTDPIRPSQQGADREPGTREDGEALPPAAIDPGADSRSSVTQSESATDSAAQEEKRTPDDPHDSTAVEDEAAADRARMVKDATGF